MARTYTDIPEPRKVLEADTIRGYSRETVEEALDGGGGSAREISIGGSADAFAVSDNLYALTDISFDTENEAKAYIDTEIERKVTTVFLNMSGAPAPYDGMSAFTFILRNVVLMNTDSPVRVEYSMQIPASLLGGTLTGTFTAFEKSGKYYVACELELSE